MTVLFQSARGATNNSEFREVVRQFQSARGRDAHGRM